MHRKKRLHKCGTTITKFRKEPGKRKKN